MQPTSITNNENQAKAQAIYRKIAAEELNRRYTKKEMIENYLDLAAKSDAMQIKLEEMLELDEIEELIVNAS